MSTADRDPALPGRQVALVDLLDRLLAGGVVITGDLVLSIADIDLVRISLRALVSSVSTAGAPWPEARQAQGPAVTVREGRAPRDR
ncbi:gas vesicle protein [Streptomyces sp. WAC06614]|uniref:gas vesicle protein n=1 Tax=Streptomyces sp. WAC06614 TaxID=2487416 RepID=UPI000F7B335B|nr:gas vesicle protein [Streptomyces sp. WAC06614]RSS78516.1 gas vesicle protein [Streptomyces sp. WAC06614]